MKNKLIQMTSAAFLVVASFAPIANAETAECDKCCCKAKICACDGCCDGSKECACKGCEGKCAK